MPHLINYENTIIYKLCCKDESIKDIYIGHTTNFIKRKSLHKSYCNSNDPKKQNLYVYQIIRNNGNFDNWNMEVIETTRCKDVHEARKRERYYIELLRPSLNKRMPSRTGSQYYRENIDHYKEVFKNYYIKNKPKLMQKIDCPCGKHYTFKHKLRHYRSKYHVKRLMNIKKQQEDEEHNNNNNNDINNLEQ